GVDPGLELEPHVLVTGEPVDPARVGLGLALLVRVDRALAPVDLRGVVERLEDVEAGADRDVGLRVGDVDLDAAGELAALLLAGGRVGEHRAEVDALEPTGVEVL